MRHAGLGDRVDRAVGAALEGGDRADGDDAAAAPFHHAARDRLAGQDRAQQVAVEHRPHILLADVHGVVRVRLAARGRDVAAGIVNQDIDRPERASSSRPRADSAPQREVAEHANGADAMICATASAAAVSVVPSPNSAGPFSRMPWIATLAPSAASRSAKARPSPRPAPVTSATLPASARAASCDVIDVLLICERQSAREIEADGERLDEAHRRDQGAQRRLRHVLDLEHDLRAFAIGLSRLSVIEIAGTPRATSSGKSRAVSG